MTVKMLVAMLGAIVAGILLIWWGVRGKRLNDHPVCRQCRFDLSGSPQGTITCPECGAGLKRAGSVRIGQRRRRPVAMSVGSLLVALPLLAIGAAAFAILTGTNLNAYKPVAMLMWEARRADKNRAPQIATEVLNRYNNKKLTDEPLKRVIQEVLSLQADTTRPWCDTWGDLIDQATSDGKISKDDQTRYRKNAPVLEFKVRPRVKAGEQVPVVAVLKEARIGTAGMFYSSVTVGETLVDGRKVSTGSRNWSVASVFAPPTVNQQVGWLQMYGSKSRFGGGVTSMGQAQTLVNLPKDATAGRHVIKLTLLVKTVAQGNSFSMPGRARKNDPECREVTTELPVEIVGSDSELVRVVEPTEKARAAMEAMLDSGQMMAWKYDGQKVQVQHQFDVKDKPMDGAFDVFWRVGDKEYRIGSFTTGLSADNTTGYGWSQEEKRSVWTSLDDFDAKKVDVVLRPNALAAAKTVDVNEIFGGEIVYKDMEVQWQDMSGVRTSPASGLLRLFTGN